MRRADGLTLFARRMLAVLHDSGDWMSAAELAAATHMKENTNYQAALLKKMSEQGLIEIRPPYARKRPHVSYEYRAKS